MKVIIAVLLVILVVDACSLWLQSTTTSVAVVPEVKAIGPNTPIQVEVTNSDGVRRVKVWLEQRGLRFVLFEHDNPAHWIRWQRNQAPAHFHFYSGKDKVPELKDGSARLVVEAAGDDFRSASATRTYEVTIVTEPPRVSPDAVQP